MFLACSKDFINDVCHILTHKKYYDVAMLGGSSSKDFFLAINKHNPNKLPIRVFFSDERFVPTDNENSNAYTALKFLDIDKNKNPFIVDYANHKTDSYTWEEVILETIGQFTGLFDKNGKEIFENDIVMFEKRSRQIKYFTKYGMFGMVGISSYQGKLDEEKPYGRGGSSTRYEPYILGEYYQKRFVLQGNIHDNPELLTK